MFNIQSLESVTDKLSGLLLSNKNRSLSGIFKCLRKQPNISLIGDYPLLSFIIHFGYYRTPQYIWNRKQVLWAVKVSGFYKDEEKKHAFIPKEWEKFLRNGN